MRRRDFITFSAELPLASHWRCARSKALRVTRLSRRCPTSGDSLTNSAKPALIQLPHIRRRFRPATILRFEMPGERKASNTIR
jgi:hypothetical protein